MSSIEQARATALTAILDPKKWAPIGDPHDAIIALLKEKGAIYLGGKKHDKWRLPSGFIFVMSKTPSDSRSRMNELHNLRRLLGRTPWES